MDFDRRFRFLRMRHLERRSVKHLTRHSHETRIASILKPVDPVADNRKAIACEMAAYLVRAPRLDHDLKEARVVAHRLAQDLGNGLLAIQLGIDRLSRQFVAADDDGVIELFDSADLELLDSGLVGCEILRKKKTSGSVAVETVDGLQSGDFLLFAEDILGRLGLFGADQSGRLVADQVRFVLPQHADVALGRDGVLDGLRGGAFAALLDGALHNLHWNLDDIARFEGMSRHPDALAVDPDAATVNDGLGGAARKAEFQRKKILKNLRIALRYGERRHSGGMLRGGAHRIKDLLHCRQRP